MLKRIVFASAFFVLCQVAAQAQSAMLSHNVYFTLKDKSQADKLVAACHKYLKAHPGVVFFAAGKRATELAREVNDRAFDISLMVVFKTKADHDRYQTAELHKTFINENSALWSSVRVFDSFVN
jgi:hypothetical protein